MNRCTTHPRPASPRRSWLALALALPLAATLSAGFAQTTVRPFPPNAERGTLVVTYPPIIQLNGKQDRLSPGARIRGMDGLLVLSGNIVGQSLVVNFVREPMGQVHEVWILTPQEAALKLPTQP